MRVTTCLLAAAAAVAVAAAAKSTGPKIGDLKKVGLASHALVLSPKPRRSICHISL